MSPEVHTMPAWEAPASSRRDHPFVVGDVVGGAYRVTAVLGEGGMGAVYEAEDLGLGRRVAVKVGLTGVGDAVLQREARILGAIRHPGVVTAHAFGRHGQHDYLVMERLAGCSLRARLDELSARGESMSLPEVMRILIGAAEALVAVHRAGVAHRDLKPENVFLAGPRVVLVDFGLVDPTWRATAEPLPQGTPAYIAPEVLLQSAVPDEMWKADLYGFGILAFELLVGHTPFASSRVPETLAKHLLEEAPNVASLRADVPPMLAELIAELLAKQPADRPERSEAIVWRLRAIPVAADHHESVPPSAPRLRVLVIDDDEGILRILERSVSRALPKLTIETTNDAATAVRTLDRARPDVVIVDLHMPTMNGMEVVKALSALPKDKRPVVAVMSSEADAADVALLRSMGADRFVPKDMGFVAGVCDVIGDLRMARAVSTG